MHSSEQQPLGVAAWIPRDPNTNKGPLESQLFAFIAVDIGTYAGV